MIYSFLTTGSVQRLKRTDYNQNKRVHKLNFDCIIYSMIGVFGCDYSYVAIGNPNSRFITNNLSRIRSLRRRC